MGAWDPIPSIRSRKALAREDIIAVVYNAVWVTFTRSGDGHWTIIVLAASLGTETERLLICLNSLDVQD